MGEVHRLVRCISMLEEDAVILLTWSFVFLLNPTCLVLWQKRSRVLVRISKLADSFVVKVGGSLISLRRLKVLLRRLTRVIGKILSAPLIDAFLRSRIKPAVGGSIIRFLIQGREFSPLVILDNIANVSVLLRAFLFLLWR